MFPDPAWAGRVTFYELLFGAPIAYALLVLLWERVLRAPKPEWQYGFFVLVVAGAFLVNHYFQFAPFWMWLINGYALVIYVTWFFLLVRVEDRSIGWKIGATLAGVVFTICFSLAEGIARYAFGQGLNEFWIMLAAWILFLMLAAWRGRANRVQR